MILHVDIDAFFASIEQRRDPRLRGRPVIVGTGVIASCSYEARRFGLKAGMTLSEARRLCPQAVVLAHRIKAVSPSVRFDSEYRIRQVLHRKFLYSSAFAVRLEREPAGAIRAITLRGAGWGHGVGMCQIGALGMALCGIDYETICRHYYPKAELATVYP